ncbi:MAG: hypothetical protein AAGC68_14920, partial [Verrucomicrobiota bacterium]
MSRTSIFFVGACTVTFLFAGARAEENLIVRDYQVSPRFFDSLTEKDARYPSGNVKWVTAKRILMDAGVPFGKGARASYDANKQRLRLTNTPESLLIVEDLLSALSQAGETLVRYSIEEWVVPKDNADLAWMTRDAGRVQKEGKPMKNGIHLAGIFTRDQFEVVRRVILEKGAVLREEVSPIVARSGEDASVSWPHRRYHFSAQDSSDRTTVNLVISSQTPHMFGWSRKSSPIDLTVWDGSTIVFSAEKGTVTFLTSRLIEPGGFEFHTDEEIDELVAEASTEE